MLQWMLYATLVALMASLAAAAWERAASLCRFPSRWAWVAALALSASIPLVHTLAPMTVSEQFLEVVAASSITHSDAAAPAGLPVHMPLIESSVVQRMEQWLGIAWLCSSAIASLMFALGLYAVKREQRLGSITVIAGHRVVITESLGPAVIGLTNPTILLPGWIRRMSARQCEVVIAHELQHVRARDEWLIGAAICVLIVFPWNIALWWQLKRLRLAIELDCDQRVLRSQFEPGEYGQVLIDAASLGAHHTAVAPALIESTSSLEKRIRTMLRSRASYDKPLIGALALASLAICATAAAFMVLQLRSMRFGPNPALVILGVNPGTAPIDATAPALDMSAIRRDRDWLEGFLVRKTASERAMIKLADSAAIDIGLTKGTELWIALSAEGKFIRGGRRNIITDPNESRRFVENALPAARIGYTARGTAVRDATGTRVAVAWHWLQE